MWANWCQPLCSFSYNTKSLPNGLSSYAEAWEPKFKERIIVISMRITQANPPWGLDRIDQRNRPVDSSYTYTSTGSAVTAYVIDTTEPSPAWRPVGHPRSAGRCHIGADPLYAHGRC